MYDHILVPTDGSDPATAAVAASVEFARAFGSNLRIAHVLAPGELPPGVEDEAAGEFERRGSDALEAAAETAATAGVEATTALVEATGSVHGAILEIAREQDLDCIVIGTHGRTGVDRLVLGSVAEQTLRESPVPVWTVHEDTTVDPDVESVLVPTDGSQPAASAVDHAADLASATGATLHVLNGVFPAGAWPAGGPPDVVLDSLEEAGRETVQAAAERAEHAGVSAVETAVVSGSPHRAVLDYAEDRDVDCIVMGTHGRAGLERVLLGSVTERVVRLAKVPVVAVGDGASD